MAALTVTTNVSTRCPASRQDCRDSTGLGAELLACASQLRDGTGELPGHVSPHAEEVEPETSDLYLPGAVGDLPVQQGRTPTFRRALGGCCDSSVLQCASARGPGEPPGGTAVCKAQGKAAFQAVRADCKVTFQGHGDACLERTPPVSKTAPTHASPVTRRRRRRSPPRSPRAPRRRGRPWRPAGRRSRWRRSPPAVRHRRPGQRGRLPRRCAPGRGAGLCGLCPAVCELRQGLPAGLKCRSE